MNPGKGDRLSRKEGTETGNMKNYVVFRKTTIACYGNTVSVLGYRK